MTGIIVNNNEYMVSTGSTEIEYASTGDSVGFSCWGENIPANPIKPVPDTVVLEYSTAGSYSLDLQYNGKFELWICTGGDSTPSIVGSSSWGTTYLWSGASGCLVKTTCILNKGSYVFTIGMGGRLYTVDPHSGSGYTTYKAERGYDSYITCNDVECLRIKSNNTLPISYTGNNLCRDGKYYQGTLTTTLSLSGTTYTGNSPHNESNGRGQSRSRGGYSPVTNSSSGPGAGGGTMASIGSNAGAGKAGYVKLIFKE